jgi:hypothetical protein
VISTGGIEGLKTYLMSQTTTTTTTTTVVADYQIVTANNVDYHVYNNGSVYTAGKLVCTGGIEGLKTYLLKGASATAATTTTTTSTTTGGVAQQAASTVSTTYTTYTTSTTSAGGVTTTSSTTGAKALFAD